MLAYAAHRPVAAQRRPAPNAMLAIIALHVAAVAALMSARMDLPDKFKGTRTVIELIQPLKPPPPRPVEGKQPEPRDPTITYPSTHVPLPPIESPFVSPGPTPNFDDIVGPSLDPGPKIIPVPIPAPVKIGARLLTPPSEVKPPYPHSKLASGEEAVLRLSLAIDERGRVVAVEPVGRADKVFVDAARRHLLAHWRYRPATEDGRPVSSSITVILRFQLEA